MIKHEWLKNGKIDSIMLGCREEKLCVILKGMFAELKWDIK